jgi:hypothetical protein
VLKSLCLCFCFIFLGVILIWFCFDCLVH